MATAAATFVAHTEKTDSAYAPSFDLDGSLLGERHGAIHDEVAGIDGWLEPEDSLKLYELAYLADGPFLEVGTYRGKSTTVLASAVRDAGRQVALWSIDIDHRALESAAATLAARGLGAYVTLSHGSLRALFRAVPSLEPRFVFLDGDHSAAGLARDLATLERRVPTGSLLLFHDFTDVRNDDPADRDYGVPQAIRASWVERDCAFAGTFGCSALYRRVRGPSGAPLAAGDGPQLLELLRLDRVAVRLRVEVARPMLKRVRRLLGRPQPGDG